MTEEQAESAEYALRLREFEDKQEEHPWNIIQMERMIGGSTLTVWGRHWSPDKSEPSTVIQLAEVTDIAVLVAVVDKAIDFLKFIITI